ncbi:hypothetical protein [Microbispora sp. NPDC049125]|uniref:hypothetical protein n=1 Tax=Microbispora sp. NPDC049125 TaxID=3154929 RepID=UPI003467A83A
MQYKVSKMITDGGLPIGSGYFRQGLVFADSQRYSNKLVQQHGLADDPAFRTALPDVETATYAAYVNTDRLEKWYLRRVDPGVRADVARLQAIGLSGRQGEGGGGFTLRLVLNQPG